MSTILLAENISKQYRLGTVGTGTLGHDLNRWWHRVRGKEDPYLTVGAVNDRSAKASEDYIWALRDINFEVKQGEVLGIIGKNGAGKSTLLKILSRVTAPTTGSIKTKGRIASLLEIGTGFHPELTGRENIFMNGAVLGMTRAEIKRKLEEIISFSGCEMYIDTPVKRYSSGMTVRLGFAVAAHLEPEILVVDEVLAVGDAEFQKKAIGKMQDLSTGEGRTVLFVSHNMVSIQQLCTRCLLLENGISIFNGKVTEGIDFYLSDRHNRELPKNNYPVNLKSLDILKFGVTDLDGREASTLKVGSSYIFHISLKNNYEDVAEFNVRLQLFNENEELLTTLNTFHTNDACVVQPKEKFSLECMITKLPVSSGKYSLGLQITNLRNLDILYESNAFESVEIIVGDFYGTGKIPTSKNEGKILLDYQWHKAQING